MWGVSHDRAPSASAPRADAEHGPVLDEIVPRKRPRAVLLVLHGGQQRSEAPVLRRHASWWRMWLIAQALRGPARAQHWRVCLLRYRVRGWNDASAPAPVADARWALGQVRSKDPGVPVVLVGHSMGGRTACRVADDEAVRGVVALAPWLPAGEPVAALRDRALHVLHGTADRWTSPTTSKAFVERCRGLATEATWTPMAGVGHFMLRRVRRWNAFVEESAQRILRDADAREGAS